MASFSPRSVALLVILFSAVGSVGACDEAPEADTAAPAPAEAVLPGDPAPDTANPTQLVREGRGAQHAGDDTAARKSYARACSLGDAEACLSLAELLDEGLGGPPEPERARALYEQACASGASEACDALGH